LLSDCQAKAVVRHDNLRLIEVKALWAQVLTAQGQEPAALAVLHEAIQLAAPGGALRLFVDCGPRLIPLLKKLADERKTPDYVRSILAALGPELETTRDVGRVAAAAPHERAELLTYREIDVLTLLAERLSDKEIAAQLVLSPETVKKHTARIYEKLGVDNRRAAVAEARRLGLL
jgi:LuxR family maltose regulon positive regulatory protein